MRHLFASSGVETYLWLPPAVALGISFFTSMGGVSGAFLLLPFQMSVLNFASPAVSPTNLVFNMVAIPSGVYRYLREGRMVWPLTWSVVLGTVPGVVVGGLIRLHWLPDARPFKAFVGCVLLFIGVRLLLDGIRSKPKAPQPERLRVEVVESSWRRLVYRFEGNEHRCSQLSVFVFAVLVGVVGGTYGIGGGSIIAPALVAVYGLPVHTIAGATLMGTFCTSIVGVLFYQLIAPLYGTMRVAPDWALGALFGVGGVVGMYFGARTQRLVSARWLKLLIAVLILYVAARYVVGYVILLTAE